jgi:hypothetical protein
MARDERIAKKEQKRKCGEMEWKSEQPCTDLAAVARGRMIKRCLNGSRGSVGMVENAIETAESPTEAITLVRWEGQKQWTGGKEQTQLGELNLAVKCLSRWKSRERAFERQQRIGELLASGKSFFTREFRLTLDRPRAKYRPEIGSLAGFIIALEERA